MNIIDYLANYIRDCTNGDETKSIMLTGGRSAEFLYKRYHEHCPYKEIKNVNFFLTDERFVLPNSPDSNQKLIKENFFSELQLSSNSFFYTFDTTENNSRKICQSYESLMPDTIDLMILSMGEDGHIASLFPNSKTLEENSKLILPTTGPKPPYERFTISPKVINNAKEIFILCFGYEKQKKYEEVLLNPDDYNSIPARLVLDRNWVFDIEQQIDFKK